MKICYLYNINIEGGGGLEIFYGKDNLFWASDNEIRGGRGKWLCLYIVKVGNFQSVFHPIPNVHTFFSKIRAK